MPDVSNLSKRILNYSQINKVDQDEAKKALEKEDTRNDEENTPSILTFDADEDVIAEQDYKAMIERLRLAGKLETISLTDASGNDLGITLTVNKSERGANYTYTFENNKLTINANKCIVQIAVDETLTNSTEINAAKEKAADIDVVLSGVHVKLNSDVAVKSITSSAINAIINGSNDADTIVATGMNTTINARGGSDTVTSKGMKGIVRAGSGNDNIKVTGMGSNVFGTSGNNEITANGVGMFVDAGRGESTLDVHGRTMAVNGGVSGNSDITAQGQDITVISGNASNDITLSGKNVSVEYDNETAGDTNLADRVVINGETVQEKTIDAANGFDENGYRAVSDGKGGTRRLNFNGYDAQGYNIDGYDAQGYNASGVDKDNYNVDGYKAVVGADGETRLVDKDGYDQNGYNPDKIGTKEYYKDGYNEHGYDKNGYDQDGYNIWGVDKNGDSQTHEDGFDSKGKLWKDGKLYTGIYSENNLMYERGSLLTGVSSVNQNLYNKGVLDTKQQVYDGKLYNGGSVDTTKQDFQNVLYVGGVKSKAQEDEFEKKLYRNGDLVTDAQALSSTDKLYVNGSLATGLVQCSENNRWYNNGTRAQGRIGDKYYEDGEITEEPDHPENGIDASGRRWIDNTLASGVVVDEKEVENEGSSEKSTVKEYHLYAEGYLSDESNKVVNDNGKKYLFNKGSLAQGETLYKNGDVEILFQQGTPAAGLVTYNEVAYYNGYKADGVIYENNIPSLYNQGSVDTTEKLVTNVNNPYTNKTETVLFKNGEIAGGLETFGGVTYYNGTPATGEYGGSTYENGQKISGKKVSDDGKLYVDGDLATGTQDYQGTLYVDGIKSNAAETEHENKLYLSGNLATGTQVSNTNILYVDGVKAEGTQDYEGTLYVDGERAQGTVGNFHYTDGKLTNGTVGGVEYEGGEAAFNPDTAVEATEDVATAVVNLAKKVSAAFGTEIQNIAASTATGVSLVNVKYTSDGSAISEFTVTTENGTRTYHINYYNHEPKVEHETHRYADRTESVWRYYYAEGALRREELSINYNNNTYKNITNEYAEDGLNTGRIVAENDVDGNYTKSWYELDKNNELYLDCKHYNGIDADGDRCNSWEYFYQSGALKNNDITTYYKDGSSYSVANNCTESGVIKSKVETAYDTMSNFSKLWYELDENNELYAQCKHFEVKDDENNRINIWEYCYTDGSVKSKDITTTFINGDTHNIYETYTNDGTVKSRTESENIDEGHYTKVWYELDDKNSLYVATKHHTVTNEDGTKFNTWEYYYTDESVKKTDEYIEEVNGIKKNEVVTSYEKGEKASTIADIDNHNITAENTVTTVEHNSDSTIKKFTVVSGASEVEGLINYYDSDDYYVHRYEDGANIWEWFRADRTIKSRDIYYSNGNALYETFDHNGKVISKKETTVSEKGTTTTWSELNTNNELYVTTSHYNGIDKNGDDVNEWRYYYENNSTKNVDSNTRYKDGSSYGVYNTYTENGMIKSKVETAWDTMGNYAKVWYELDENNELYADCEHFNVKDKANNSINIWQYNYTDGSVKSKDITTNFVNGDTHNIYEAYTNDGTVKSRTESENIDEGHYTKVWYELDDNGRLYIDTKHHTNTYADGSKLNTWEYCYPDGSVKKSDIYTEEVNGIKKNETINDYAQGEHTSTIAAINNHDITADNTKTSVEHNEDTTIKKFTVVSGDSMIEGLINYYDSDDYYVHRYEDGANILEWFRADGTIKTRDISYGNGNALYESFDRNGKIISRNKTEKTASGTTKTWEELDAQNELYVTTRYYNGLDNNGDKTVEWDYYYENHNIKSKDIITYYSDGSSKSSYDTYTESGIHNSSIIVEHDKDGNYIKTWYELNEHNVLYKECEHYNGVDSNGDKCNSWKYYRSDDTLKSIDVTTYYKDGSTNDLYEKYAEDGVTVIDRTRSATHADGHYIKEWYELDANGNVYRDTVHTTTKDANGASVNTWEYYYTDGVSVKKSDQTIRRTDGTVEETIIKYDIEGNPTYKSVYTKDSETTQTVYYERNEATGELYISRIDKNVSKVSDDGTRTETDVDYYTDGKTKKTERIYIRYPNGSRHEENIKYAPDGSETGKTIDERDAFGNTLYIRSVLGDDNKLYVAERRYDHIDESGNRIHRTETYYDDGSLKSYYETITDVSGHTRTNQKDNYVKGEAYGEITDSVFKNGFYEEEIDGERVRVHYTGGARTTGKVDGIMYKNGLPANGDVNNSLYKNGILDTKDQIYEGKLYLGGSIPKGIAKFTGDDGIQKVYNNGILLTGKNSEDSLMYENGLILTGISSVNQKLYKNGEVDITKQDYEGRLYKNGVLQTKTQEFDVNGETRLYIGGYFASDKKEYILKTSESEKLFLNGIWAKNVPYYEYDGNSQLFVNGVLSTDAENEYNNHLYRSGKKVYGWAVSGNLKLYSNGNLYTEKYAYDGKLFDEGSLDTKDQDYNNCLYIGGYLSKTKRDFENKLYGEDGRLDRTTQGFVVAGVDRLYIDGQFAQDTAEYALETDTTVKLYLNGVFASSQAEYEYSYYYFENGVLSSKADVTLGSGNRYLKGLLVEERYYNMYVGGKPYTGNLDGVHYENGVHADGIDPNTNKYWVDGRPATGIYEIEGRKRLYNNGDWNQSAEAEYHDDEENEDYLFENGYLSTTALKLSKTNKLYANGVLTKGRIEYGSGDEMRVFYNGLWANGYLPAETGDTNYYINGKVSDPDSPDIPGVNPDAEITGGSQASSADSTKAKAIISDLISKLPSNVSYYGTYSVTDLKDATIYDAVYTGGNLTSFTAKLPLVLPSTGTTVVHYNVTYSGSNVATVTEQEYEPHYNSTYSNYDYDYDYDLEYAATSNYSACKYYYESGKVVKVEEMKDAANYSDYEDTEDSTITYIEYGEGGSPKYMRRIGESALIYNYADNNTRNYMPQTPTPAVYHTSGMVTSYETESYASKNVSSGDSTELLDVSHTEMSAYMASDSDSTALQRSTYSGDLLTKRTNVSSTGSNGTIECTYNDKKQLLTEKCINGATYVAGNYENISFVYGSCSTATFTVSYTYNAQGLPSKVTQTDDYGNVLRTIEYTYNADKFYSTIKMTDTDNSVTLKEYTYNSDKLYATIRVSKDGKTQYYNEYKYNSDKMLSELKHTDKDNKVVTTTYTYNSAKLPKTVVSRDEEGKVSTAEYTYNSKGQIVAEKLVSNVESTEMLINKEYRYDENSRLVYEKAESKYKYSDSEQYVNGSATTTIYTRYDNGDYKSIQTVETEQYGETTTTLQEFDENGFLILAKEDVVNTNDADDNSSSQVTYTYANGYMTGKVVTGDGAHSEAYTYHANNNVASYTYTSPSGAITVINYDDKGNITTRTKTNTSAASVTETFTYNTNGSISQINSSNGAYTHYTYDAKGMLTGIEKKDTSGTVKSSVYNYDTAERLTKITENGALKKEITYDANGVKLSEKEYVAQTTTYGFTTPAHTIERQYNSHGQITYDSTVYNPENTSYKTKITTYEYNSNGSLLKKETKDKDGNIVERYTYEYSPTTKVKTKETHYNPNAYSFYIGNDGEYKYGLVEQTTVSTFDASSGKLTTKTITINGEEKEYTTYYSDGQTKHTSRTISRGYDYNTNANMVQKIETTYNENEKETLVIKTSKDGTTEYERTTNVYYDDNKTLKTKTYYDYYGATTLDDNPDTVYIPATTVTQYNAKAKVTSEVKTDINGQIVSRKYNEYRADNETISKTTEYTKDMYVSGYGYTFATKITQYDESNRVTSVVYKGDDTVVVPNAETIASETYTYSGNQTTKVTYLKRGGSNYVDGERVYYSTEEAQVYKTIPVETEYGTYDQDCVISDVTYDVTDSANRIKMTETKNTYVSDSSAQLSQSEVFDYHGRGSSYEGYIPTKITRTYNTSDKITHSVEINTDTNEKLYETTNEYYDDGTALKKKTYYDYHGKSEYVDDAYVYTPTTTVTEYNEKGEITHELETADGVKQTETTNEYYADGTTLKKKTYYDYHGKSEYVYGTGYVYTPTTEVTEYNEKSKRLHYLKTAEGVKLSETITTYQSDGETLKKEVTYNSSASVSYYDGYITMTNIEDYDATGRVVSEVARVGDNTTTETGDMISRVTYTYTGNKTLKNTYITRGGRNYSDGEYVYYPTEKEEEYVTYKPENSYYSRDYSLRETNYVYNEAGTQKTKTTETIRTWDSEETPHRVTQKTEYDYQGEYMYDPDTATSSYVPTLTTIQYNENEQETSNIQVTADGTNVKLHETTTIYHDGSNNRREQSVYNYKGEYIGSNNYMPTTTVTRWNEQGSKTYERETSEDGNNTIYNDYSCTYYADGQKKNVEISTNSDGETTTKEYYDILAYDYGSTTLQKSEEKKNAQGVVTERTSYTYHDNKKKATENYYKLSGISKTYTFGAYRYYYSTNIPTYVYIEYDDDEGSYYDNITKLEVKDAEGNTIEPTNTYDA